MRSRKHETHIDTSTPIIFTDQIPGFSRPPRSNLLWLAVDLDGTLAESLWTAGNPTSQVGAPIARNVAKLKLAVAAGYKIVIHTARPWTDYEVIEAWLDHHSIPWHKILPGKILAALYIDDRGRHESAESWVPGEPAPDNKTVTVGEMYDAVQEVMCANPYDRRTVAGRAWNDGAWAVMELIYAIVDKGTRVSP